MKSQMRSSMKLGVVLSDFHASIAEEMLHTTKKTAEAKGIDIVSIVRVTGAFDVPLALKRMLARQDIDGAVVLGAVVQGQTSHDEVVAYTAAEKIMELSLQYDKPVGYGICGPRMSIAQARARAKEFAVRAVEAIKRGSIR